MHITICLAALLTVAAGAVWFLGLMFVVAVVSETPERPTETRNDLLAIDDDGRPLRVTITYRSDAANVDAYSHEVHDLDGNAVDVTSLKLSDRIVTLTDSRLLFVSKRWSLRERIRSLDMLTDAKLFFRDTGQDGYFEYYARENGRRMGYLGRNGYSETEPSSAERFPTRSGQDRGVLTPWFSMWSVSHTLPNGALDQSGDTAQSPWIQTSLETDERFRFVEPGGRRVHFIDPWKRHVLGVIDVESEPVQAVGVLWLHKAALSPIILRTATTLLVCSQADTPKVVRTVTLPEPMRNVGVLQWLPLGDPVAGGGENLFIQMRDNDWRLIWSDDAGRILRESLVPGLTRSSEDIPEEMAAWSSVAVQSPLLVDVAVWVSRDESHPWHRALALHRAAEFGLSVPSGRGAGLLVEAMTLPLIALHLSGVFWSVLAARRLRRFGGSRFDHGFWLVWTLAFGLPGYLAFRAHRTWGEGGWALLPVASQETQTGKSAHPPATAAGFVLSGYEKLLDAGEHCGAAVAARVGLPAGHTALLLKEFRITAGMALLSLLAYWLVVASSVGVRGFTWLGEYLPGSGGSPFVQAGIFEPFMAITIVLGVCLAVWQIVTEARHQAWLFVLYRPVSRRTVLVIKIVVGLSVLMGCSAMPIVLSGVLASTPGMVAAPFEWSMTADAWRCWWSLSPVYLAMLLTMLRPARWIGTKAFPAVAACLWLIVREFLGIATEPAWFEVVAVTAFNATLITCLLLVLHEREYS